MSASQSARGGSSSQVGIILATVFLAYLGQTTLNPVIAPLSREVGLDEWQIGFTISVAAVMVVLTSQVWGLKSLPPCSLFFYAAFSCFCCRLLLLVCLFFMAHPFFFVSFVSLYFPCYRVFSLFFFLI